MQLHLAAGEGIQQLQLKVVRRGRGAEGGGAREWHAAIDQFALVVTDWEGITMITKIESELEVTCRSDAWRQKNYEKMKNEMQKRDDMVRVNAMVVMARPSLRSALSRPCSFCYGWMRRRLQDGGRPDLRTLGPTMQRQHWAIFANNELVVTGAVASCGTAIKIEVKKEFTVGQTTMMGKELMTELQQDLSRGYLGYPFSPSYALKGSLVLPWVITPFKGEGRGGGGRGRDGGRGLSGGKGGRS